MAFTPIYNLRVAEVYRALESSPDGLSSSEVEARRSLYGSNILAEVARAPLWRRILPYIAHPMALALWLAGITFLVVDPVIGLVICLLVLVNAGFSFWREYRAEQAMTALRQMLPAYARVIRDGVEVRIAAAEIVPGDILVLAEGDNIPADARVVEEYGLRTDNSTLTGEALPSRKVADASLVEGISELERPNLVFAGTSVVSGTGKAVVFDTGMLTQFGRIARLTQVTREEPSQLQREMLKVTRVIAVVAASIAAITLMVGFFDLNVNLGEKKEIALLAIGLVVAAIPEGLPATVTLTLAMASLRLAQRGVLVKKLSAVETLGLVSVICTDKSGTLTQNQMTVRQVWVSGQQLSVSGVGYEPVGEFYPAPKDTRYEGDLMILLEAASLCNNARLNPPSPEHPFWTSLGDQTEAALRVVARKAGIDEHAINVRYPRVHELPFDARRKRMSTIHRNLHGEVVFLKGAPREVLQLCTHILQHGEVCPLDDITRAEILAANDHYARNALRVLAFARRELPPRVGAYTVERIEHDLTFLGLLAMMDPPRPEVAEAVGICREAGIRLVMITGDYGLTAESLARRVGMVTVPNPVILTGAELEVLNDIELQNILEQEVVFARMAPEHKLRLVSAFQARGEVVAVTGDGVNDAPAMRKADIGIAMGLVGTDVAKEASEVIITNDNFAAIVEAIREGRTIYANLRKFITYIFSSNVPEMMPFILTAMFSRIPLALNVKQILMIDLGTDLFPGLALGMEKPEPDIMRHPPRRKTQPLIDRGLLLRAFLWLGIIEAVIAYVGFAVVWLPSVEGFTLHLSLPKWLGIGVLHSSVDKLAVARSVYFVGVVLAQIGNAFACRAERNRGRQLGWLSNPFLARVVFAEIVMLVVLVYTPLGDPFDLFTFPLQYWIVLSLFPLFLYGLDWIRKGFLRRSNGHPLVSETSPEIGRREEER